MKITIDTKSDSKEEIRRAVELLNNLLGNRSNQPRNVFEDNTPSSNNPFSMFDNSQETTQPSPPSNNAFSSMFGGDSTPSNNSYPSSNNTYSDSNKTSKDDDDEEPVVEYY